MKNYKDFVGKRFGKLVVIGLGEKPKEKKVTGRYWLCKCDCGNEKCVSEKLLKRGGTKSCGCLSRKIGNDFTRIENKYNLTGKYGVGYTNKGEAFYFDLEDYSKIKKYCWHCDKKGYIKTKINYCGVFMHRFILNPDSDMVIDHIDGNTVDNRKENLRIVTIQQNSQNRITKTKNTSSKYFGVRYRKEYSKWCAQIWCDGASIHLGNFDDEDDAAKAYNKKAKEFGFLTHNIIRR